MRFLKKSQLSSHNVKDNGVAIDINGQVIFDTTNVMLVPKGATSDRPLSPVNGHLRYNTTINQLEGYQNSAWRSVRFKEATTITQQNLGTGDYVETTFGPLNPVPTAAQNAIVLVENVFQISNTNYTMVQNPANVTASIISFTSGVNLITSGSTALVDFAAKGFRPGQKIMISGSSSNNGLKEIVSVTSTTLETVEALINEAAGLNVSIIGRASDDLTPYTAGYYFVFGEAVPVGKDVTVLHGFDS